MLFEIQPSFGVIAKEQATQNDKKLKIEWRAIKFKLKNGGMKIIKYLIGEGNNLKKVKPKCEKQANRISDLWKDISMT